MVKPYASGHADGFVFTFYVSTKGIKNVTSTVTCDMGQCSLRLPLKALKNISVQQRLVDGSDELAAWIVTASN